MIAIWWRRSLESIGNLVRVDMDIVELLSSPRVSFESNFTLDNYGQGKKT